MKEVEYEELDLKGDEQVFHMWEPLNFEIKDDYKYIIDNKILYHCGASFKDLGKKCFAINKINNINILNDLINKLK